MNANITRVRIEESKIENANITREFGMEESKIEYSKENNSVQNRRA